MEPITEVNKDIENRPLTSLCGLWFSNTCGKKSGNARQGRPSQVSDVSGNCKTQSVSAIRADIRAKRKLREIEREKKLINAKCTAEKYKIRRDFEQAERGQREREALLLSGGVFLTNRNENESENNPLESHKKPSSPLDDDPFAEQVKVVDGRLVVQAPRSIATLATRKAEKRLVVEENGVRYYNQCSFQKAVNRSGARWRPDEVELFYLGLTAWGLNFEAIAKMIPGKTRLNVRNKYKSEFSKSPALVKKALGAKQKMGLEEYALASGINLNNLKEIEEKGKHDDLL